MMAVATLTLGVKVCGWHGYRLVFCVTALGAIAELWRNGKAYAATSRSWASACVGNPILLGTVLAILAVFLLLFRAAALAGF
jgi:hypothetical protein